jgi:hypothetical protein
MLGIYRHRGSFVGVLHALVHINSCCPQCGPQLRDEKPRFTAEEFAARVMGAAEREKDKAPLCSNPGRFGGRCQRAAGHDGACFFTADAQKGE